MQGKVAKNKFNTSFSLPQNIKERYRRAAHQIHSSPGAVGGAELRLSRLTQRPRPRGQRDADGSAIPKQLFSADALSRLCREVPRKAIPEPSVLGSGEQCEPGAGAGSAPGYRLLSAWHGHIGAGTLPRPRPHPQSVNGGCRDTRLTPSITEPGPLQQGPSRSKAASRTPSHPSESTKRRRMGRSHYLLLLC